MGAGAGRDLPDQLVFAFDHPHRSPADELAGLLGGKGAALATMTRALGLPVPPGFTIATTVSRRDLARGPGTRLADEVDAAIDALQLRTGTSFGEPANPLLVSVRSGAPISMPGMMDTVLNIGLTAPVVQALVDQSGDARFGWDSYRRLIYSYATTVLNLPAEALAGSAPRTRPSADASARELQDIASGLLERVEQLSGAPFPQSPGAQLWGAIDAVLASWNSPRARLYREHERIDDQLGTAVNVQQMVFGNRDDRSGTGVAFSRNPTTGANEPYGDFLKRAQGEDVVDGSHHPLDLATMADDFPESHAELLAIMRRLEVSQRDLVEIEFTVEQDRLWILQTRRGKRTDAAAVRIAVDLTHDQAIRLTKSEALARLADLDLDQVRTRGLSSIDASPLAVGIGVTPGIASGRAYFDADRCLDAADRGEQVILVRVETAPGDIHGMAVANGLLTTRGGRVSHAAVVARSWGIVAVCGAEDLVVTGEQFTAPSAIVVREGDLITLNGTTGEVHLGEISAVAARAERPGPPEFVTVAAWRAEARQP